MTNYLYDLEKKILIKDIWESEIGYNLMNSKDNPKYLDLAMVYRLKKHINDRIEELCQKLSV